jgi:hypothetical protein
VHLSDILDALAVLGSFAAVYAVVPLLALGRRAGANGPERICWSLCGGMAVQSLAGFAWNHLVGGRPGWSIGIYFLVWAAIGFLAHRGRRDSPREPRARGASVALLLILLAGVGLRLVHPMQHMALGQSDAYGHLQFLRDVVGMGRVGNAVYPPGYAWILALPTLLFGLDPYVVARFGGACFGAALILVVFVTTRDGWGTAAGLVAAFLAACFPPFLLLQKTSVGCFANQWGLVLVPACVGWLCRILGGNLRAGWAMVLLMASLAVTVPMMWLSALAICGIAAVAAPASVRLRIAAASVLLAASLPAGALLLLHVARLPPVHREVTANIVAGGGQPVREQTALAGGRARVANLVSRPAKDFLSVKRRGYGSARVNAAAAAIAMAFAAALIAGRAKASVFTAVLGAWGLLASVQSATGWLQFTAYQREGWSLMIACACLGGRAGAAYELRFRRPWVMAAAAAAALLATGWAFAHPPAHRFTYSDAEEEIVRTVRALSRPEAEASSPLQAMLRARLGGDGAVVARAFTGFSGHQGDPVHAVAGPDFAGRVVSVDGATDLGRVFAEHPRAVVLLDGASKSRADGGLLPGWQADQYARFLEIRRGLQEMNVRIEKAVRDLDPAAYEVLWFEAGPALRLATVTRAADKQPAREGR